MEEINLKELFNYFWSKIGIIVIITLAFVLAGAVYSSFIQKPLYKSSTTLVLVGISNSNEESSAITQNDVSINQKLLPTYRAIMKSRKVLNQVIANLNLDTAYDELKEEITVTSDTDTELIRISISNKDAGQAKRIADEVAKVFSSEIASIYSIKNISIIDAAERESTPYNINVLKETTISGIIGLCLALVLVFIIFYFDTSIKSTQEVEERLGLPLLGAVPLSRARKSEGSKK